MKQDRHQRYGQRRRWLAGLGLVVLGLAGVGGGLGLAVTEAAGGELWGGLCVVVIAVVIGLALFGAGAAPRESDEARVARLHGAGLRGTGRLLEFKDTGAEVGTSVQVELRLEIEAGELRGEVVQTEAVPRLLVHTLVPGRVFPVLVDPNDIEDVLVEWDRLMRLDGDGEAGS